MNKPVVSLCMPTNGVVEWVFPVLDSIFEQGIECELFEVIITDNGNNKDFKKKIKSYLMQHPNIIYTETNSLPFLNEIESYKRASGELIKFVNHRTMLTKGTLQKLIDFSKDNVNEKPVVYFSNGVLNLKERQFECNSFDLFVRTLSYWSSWSTGMAFWKEDFERLPEEISYFNELFPHTTVLFHERNRRKYVIDNTVIFNEISQGKKPKGNYNLFFAFGVEYPGIISDLLRDKSISSETYRYVADKNLQFIAELYFDYCIRHRYCSYDLSGLDDMFGIFYSRNKLNRKVIAVFIERVMKKIIRKHAVKND